MRYRINHIPYGQIHPNCTGSNGRFSKYVVGSGHFEVNDINTAYQYKEAIEPNYKGQTFIVEEQEMF